MIQFITNKITFFFVLLQGIFLFKQDICSMVFVLAKNLHVILKYSGLLIISFFRQIVQRFSCLLPITEIKNLISLRDRFFLYLKKNCEKNIYLRITFLQ